MPHEVAKTTSKKTITTTDLRNVAIGLSAAIAIVMLASALSSDSGSVSASDSELNDLSAKRFVSISVTTVAGDNTVTKAEASAGFEVVGVTDETGETVSCSYGGVTDSVTAHASTGAFTCLFDDDGTGTYADMSGVSDGTVIVTATVSGTSSSNFFATQDITAPTMTITTGSVASGGTTNTAAIPLTFTSSESTTDFVVGDITASGCSLSSFSGSGSTYTATCTAGASGAVSVQVAADKFTDSVTNGNTVSNTYSWTADITAPTLTSVTLNSNNADNDLSIDGNTITLAFTSSETIGTPTCDIEFTAGNDATNAESITNPGGGNNWQCTVVAHDDDADGSVVFSIGFTDANGNAGTAVTATTDSSAVTHDDTVPTLSSVTIAGNGDSASRSNDGDTVTITFTASETIGTPTCDMEFGSGVDATNAETITNTGGNTWTCAVITTDSEAETAVVFSLGFSDSAGNAGVAVTATTDGSSVTHDDTVPTLSTVVESVNGAGNGNNGDTVTLTITPSEAIQQPVCTFQSGGANMAATPSYGTGSGNIRTCSIVVADGDTNGAVTFSIAFDDTAGNAGVAVTAASSGAVTIDNTHPTASAAVLAVGGTGNGNNGDSMTLTITPSETIGTPTCVFKSGGVAMANTVGYSTSGGDHICTIAVADADTDGT
ncbi:Ig-like domain-containing protein, partial [Euryarchaeota archaeon]|nr:Ig-like domain-containing protein [Euryarchaeota archaeon]